MQTLGNTSLFGDASSDPDLVRFCAGAQGFMDKGYSKGAAILKQKQRDRKGFNAFSAHRQRAGMFPMRGGHQHFRVIGG